MERSLLVSLPQLLADYTEPAFLVDGLLPIGGLSLLVGDPKVGKSVFARNLMLAIARGMPFLDRTTSPGTVIYYALEEIITQVRRSFYVMGASEEPIYFRFGPLTTTHIIEQLQQDIIAVNASIVVIDPLFDAVAIKDENVYVDVNHAIKVLVHLARSTRCHIMLVHHANKAGYRGGRGILGSQALRGATDTSIFYTMRKDGNRYVESEQRYGTPFAYNHLIFDPTTEHLSLHNNTGLEGYIYGVLKDGMSTTEWLDAAKGKGSAQTKIKAIQLLRNKKVITMVKNGKRKEYFKKGI